MDSVQSLLAIVVLVAPLAAAGGIAISGIADRHLGRWLAMLGAGLSFGAAAAALVRLSAYGADAAVPLNLGVWLASGPHDPFRIEFALAVDIPAAALAAVMSLAAFCAFGWSRPAVADGPSERLLYIAASLLLSASLGIVLSSNMGELVVFWQIAAVSAYLMSSSACRMASQAAAAKRLIVIQRVAEFWLLCALFALASGYETQSFDALSAYLPSAGVAQRFALVHFIGLCLLGAAAVRCALYPFLGWAEGLVVGPSLTVILVEGICLMPAGVLLLIRFQPLLHAATAAAEFAAYLGAASALIAAICAWSETDARRQAGLACASVLGLIVLGLSLPAPVANGWSVVLTATFIPTSAAVLAWFALRPGIAANSQSLGGPERRRPQRWGPGQRVGVGQAAIAASVALLFSGICGQGGIVSAMVGAGTDRGLVLWLALAAQFFAALAMTRGLVADRSRRGIALSPIEANDLAQRVELRIIPASWPVTVLAACGALVGLAGGALMLTGKSSFDARTSAPTLAGGNLLLTYLGCLPALAGFLVGWRRPQREAATRYGGGDGLLTRLGRNRFYGSDLLFVFIVLPTRGLAQLARFFDWFFIDGFVSGAPASAVETAEAVLEPVQGGSVAFYLASAAIATALLAAVVVWSRY